jgi:hypothetical protein
VGLAFHDLLGGTFCGTFCGPARERSEVDPENWTGS